MTPPSSGWGQVELGQVAELCLGKMLDRQKHTAGERLAYLRNQNVRWFYVDTSDVAEMFFEEHEFERYGLVRGDVLVCEGGEPGRAAIWDGREASMKFQKALHRVRTSQCLLPEWLVFHLFHDAQSGGLERYFTGTTIKHFTGSSLARYNLPLPPVNEQRRIVAKLEALQARSRRAREALDAVPPLLEKLRQSILAAAFRGDLTKDWRAQNPNTEPASALLARIRTERRKKWEESEFAKLKAKGKPPTDDRWKAKYKEPEPVDTTGLPELPEGWCWATVEEITSDIVDCLHRTPPYVEHGFPAIRTADVVPGRLLMSQARRVDRATYLEQVSRLVPQAGDILYSREGERFGLAALVPSNIELCISQRMMHFRAVSELVPAFLMWALNSPIGYSQARKEVGGSTSPHVNIGAIRKFALPVAGFREQQEVALAVEKAWSTCDRVQAAMLSTLERLDEQQASILMTAFRGELVPQDPNDEPAEVTLSRLRADSTTEPPRPRGRRSKAAE